MKLKVMGDTAGVNDNSKTGGFTMSNKKDMSNNFGKWGWSTIFMCLIGYLISGGVSTDGLNIYVGALTELRGWDRAAMLSFSTYGGWIGVILAFVFGTVIVEKVARTKWIHIGTLLVTAAAMYFYGHTQHFAVYAVCVMVVSCMTAGFGLVSPNVIQTNWFPRRKALALGWSTIGFPLCSLIWPAVTNQLMLRFGVGGMFSGIALFILAYGLVCIVWCRPTPEEVGCAPDNDPMNAEEIRRSQLEMQQYKSPWTIQALVKEKRTWLIGVGLGLMWMVTVAIVSQLVSRLLEIGYERTSAVGMLSVMGAFGIVGSWLWGWIDQKIGTKKASLLYCGWYAFTLVLLILMNSPAVAFAAVGMVGVSVGGICNLIPSMTGTIFGRKDFAAANRLISAITKGICACAYIYVAQSVKLTGGLTGAYIGLIFICAVAAVLIGLIKPFEKGGEK